MKHFVITLIATLTVVSVVDAQQFGEFPRFRIGIEAGSEIIFGDLLKPNAIRESQSYYNYGLVWLPEDYYYGCGFAFNRTDYENWYLGLKTEYSITNHIEAAIGLRAKYGNCTLSSDRDFFLWKTAESENSTNYVRINKISQQVVHLGIPIELKWVVPNDDRLCAPFFTIGVSNNFYMYDNMKVNFSVEGMNKYDNTVKAAFPTIDKYYCQFVFGTGLKFGRRNHVHGNIVFTTPMFLGSRKPCVNSLFNVDSSAIINFQTTLYIPVGKKKIVYQY